jgi:glycosyltransferase involved in cell wall biosynthesis
MKIAALLPHVEVFGGVRRYIEIGNEFVKRGHTFVLFHPAGTAPAWLEFRGTVKPFSSLADDGFDIGICGEYSILPEFDRLQAKNKYFYFVLEGHAQERGVIKKNYIFLGNSEGICRRIEKKYTVPCIRAVGGVNLEIFHPLRDPGTHRSGGNEFRILCYGRIFRRRKGIHQVIRAVEALSRRYSGIRLIFFDSLVGKDRRDPRQFIRTRLPFDFFLDLPQSRMAWLFSQADIFVGAERRAGWSNTAAEAMACGLPVVCTGSGTRDFAVHNRTALVVPFARPFFLRRQIQRLIRDPELRARLSQAGYREIQDFTWTSLAEKLESIFKAC